MVTRSDVNVLAFGVVDERAERSGWHGGGVGMRDGSDRRTRLRVRALGEDLFQRFGRE